MTIRPASPEDAPAWERMRQALWPAPPGEHAGKIARYFAGDRFEPAEVLLAVDGEGRAVGFAELSLRSHADGCRTTPVAYLEGWYVEAVARRSGVGAALMRAAEAWGRARGCREMGSDTEIENDASAVAHRALGFTEVGRLICFRKELG